MKLIFIYAALMLSVVLITTSCEEVIDLELKDSQPKLVVESLVTDLDIPVQVTLSKSTGFYSVDETQMVHGATIEITDNAGNTEKLSEVSSGIYKTSSMKGAEGCSYKMTIQVENLNIQASTTVPDKINLDSLDFEWGENPHSKGYMVNMWFNDQASVRNYYRIRLFKNGKPFKEPESGNEIILMDDKLWDGKNVHTPVKRGGAFFQIGDTVRVRFDAVNRETYDYYKALKGAIAAGTSFMSVGKGMMEGSTAPANPENNLSGEVLGYFGAATVSEKTIIIR